MNETPSSERVHIGFFGLRNAGKSSLVNAVTGQDMSVVSETKGTTTDPVRRAMELLPLGPVVIIDTPGYDDMGDVLGKKRVQKTRQILDSVHIAVIVAEPDAEPDAELLSLTEHTPRIIVHNKCDLIAERGADKFYVSAKTGENIEAFKQKLSLLVPAEDMKLKLVGDLIAPNELAVLVIPIDSAAPKGRLILPQQQVVRDLLEAGAAAICVRETELAALLENIPRPRLVITDSQAFGEVSKIVPRDVPLTSFSILFARYKGFLSGALTGAKTLDSIKNGDKILIAEGCTHHRQCDDIGTVKLPRWIRAHTNAEPEFSFCTGGDFDPAEDTRLVIHCGGCMLNDRVIRHRAHICAEKNIAMTNYGTAIAHMHGILSRATEML